ncbi:NAD(P)H-dependent oxidoreductase [Pseudodesulfovibrio sp.]|uniref:flavodoxin family protein n=1 Tax=Pseudodesulfovibrio sp. TaxID=2035812 RepID=UPI00260F8D8A|nr:NAD(P)H-dependent oxidoreductase [Pseudodesulfovibrio sp.]MDD3313614.1 NAD(P)H-dependent oxidoreductase [Pseudodesulfovibrio sp.]
MTGAVIYTCSHRRGGNSDRAAALLAEGVRDAGGAAEILPLRDYEIQHCLACGFCDKHTDKRDRDRCALGRKDQAWEAFAPLFTARTVLLASPVYFYHLPSRLKAWIDRGQQFWTARRGGEPWVADLPERAVRAVLVAGQPGGEKLFEGARLTLKYFFRNFNLTLADPLALRGLDGPGDLRARREFEEAVAELGRAAWRESA